MRNAITKILAVTVIILAFLASGLGNAAYNAAALADEQTPEPIATITITAPPEATPEPVAKPRAVVIDYHVGIEQIEAAARGCYGLDTDDEKRGFVCMIVNRAMSGQLRADGKPLFGVDIRSCVEKPGEILFFDPDAPVTDHNYELAEYCINAQLTYLLTKQYTGIIFPSNLLYCGWKDGELCFYTEIGAEPWRMA